MLKNRTTEPKEILGLNRITKKRILELCKKDKLYQTPELNDVLYLHYQGFQSIECLEEYTELKCLWLECNAISEIQGLENQTKLKCLFLQSNLIKKIENLEYCKELDTINLSQNHIRKIENCGFEVLPELNTLNISSNYLKDWGGLKDLENCKNLSVLDLSNNRIDDILVVKIFAKMPELKVLVLQGNPVVSKIPQYRKTLILECEKLTYLDSRPVFPKDRSCAEAWKRGGYEEERKENERWNRKERRKMKDSVNATIRMRNKNRKPEDQLTLLMSSDSENESDASKRKRQNKLASDVSTHSLWDEVADDSTSETTASDITVSSSTSVNTSTYSNDQNITSEISGANVSLKIPNNDEENICNDSSDRSTKVCNLADRENIEGILQCLNDSNNAIVKQNDAETKITEPQKCESALARNSEEKFKLDEQHTKKSKIAGEEIYFINDIIDSAEDSNDKYKHTIDAICQATLNNLSQSENYSETIPNRFQLQIETLNCKEDENYEPLKEMEEAMNSLIKKDNLAEENTRQISHHKNILPDKTSSETQHEQDYYAVNHQLKTDFEQFSLNMDNFITELNKDKEERKKAIEAFFAKKGISKEYSSGSSDNEIEYNSNELRLERIINQWDTETRLKSSKRRNFAAQDEKREIPVIWSPCEEKKEEMPKVHIFEETKILQPRYESEEHKGFISPSKNLLLSQQEYVTIQPGLKEEKKYKSPEKTIFQKNETAHSFYSRHDIQQYVFNIDNYINPSNKSKEADEVNDASIDQGLSSGKLSRKENRRTLTEGRLNPNEDTTVACDFEYTPIDIKLLERNSNEALNSFEIEAKELKELLQKLENENLFEGQNTDSKCHKEEKSQCNLKKEVHEQKQREELAREKPIQMIKGEEILENYKRDIEKTPQKTDEGQANGSFKQIVGDKFHEKKICGKDINVHLNSCESLVIQQLLVEIIQSLDLKPLKPKSYELVIESDEEYSYSGIKEQANFVSSETIPDFVQPFKQFLKNIATKNREEIQKQSLERPIMLYQERKLAPTTDEQKSFCLQELARQPNLKDFNCDTHNSLDEQLKQFKDKQTKKVRQMVDRVYSQRDRYNDNLEVVDGKLVVRNKSTGEVKELPQHTGHLSESDTDYDTAQSEEEEEGACCSKTRKLLKADHSKDHCDDQNYVWSVPYKPTQQKFSKILMTSALEHNYNINSIGQKNDINDIDESNDEFFSLDPQDKPNLYDNIDDKFFSSLTLEHLKLSEQDEHHIIQCSRSYEDIKKFSKLSKEKRCLTEEENELLEKMVEIKSTNKQKNLSQTLANSDGIHKEENLLLKRMVKKSKDTERFKMENLERNEVKLDVEIDRIPLYQSKATVKIFEYKYEYYDKSSSSNGGRGSSSEPDEKTNSIEDSSTKVSGNAVILEDQEKNNEIEDMEQYEEIELVENEEEDNRQDFIQNLLQRKVSVGTEKFNTTELRSSESTSSFSGLEKYSEEEKNEIERNIDVEGPETNKKLKYVPEKEYLEEKECGHISANSDNRNSDNIYVALKFSDFANIPDIRIESHCKGHQEFQSRGEVLVEESRDNLKKCVQKKQSNAEDVSNNCSAFPCVDYFHNSNKTPQPTNYEKSSQENVNFHNPSPDIPPNKEEYLQSTNTSDIDVLECNLEIIGGNDELIETITVNAEVQYDY